MSHAGQRGGAEEGTPPPSPAANCGAPVVVVNADIAAAIKKAV